MTQTNVETWVRRRACPPDPRGQAVEVRCDGWQRTRLWRPCGPPPKNARGLLWRYGDDRLRLLARYGGIYAPGDVPLHKSSPLVVDPSDENGPWALRHVVHPTWRRRRAYVSRLWLVPPRARLERVPAVVLGELVSALDRGQSVVLRGPDASHLRTFGERVVEMVGGYNA